VFISLNDCFIITLLIKVGIQNEFGRLILGEDILHFRKNLDDWLNKNNDENSRIENETEKFLKAIDAYFIVKDNLKHSLTTTLVRF
jgi:hypothetical protein